MARLQAVFWDVDGTLADTEMDGHRPAFNAAFADLLLPFIWDESLYAELLTIPGGMRRVEHYAAAAGRPLGQGELMQIRDRKRVHYRQLARQGGIRPRPGVLRLIQALDEQGIEQWIVTSSGRASVEALFEGVPAICRFMRGTITSDDVSEGKPAPDGYLLALQRSGYPPSAVIAIEDSEAGLMAARAAGLHCLLTPSPWDLGVKACRSQSVAAFDHLGEKEKPVHQLEGPPCADPLVTVEYLRSLLSGRE